MYIKYYDVFFRNTKTTIEADDLTYIQTKAYFYKNKTLVAFFDIPFGTFFGYSIRFEEK